MSLEIEKFEQFKEDLSELLEKYSANIFVEIEGDTHGLSEKMFVQFRSDKGFKDHLLSNYGYIEANHLK